METNIGIVLDASTSMLPLVDETLQGLNNYLEEQKSSRFENDGDMSVSILAFSDSHKMEWIYRNQPIAKVQRITNEQYRPNGWTALYDGINNAITEMEKRSCRHTRNILVVITDGEENASRTISRPALFELISKKQNENWTFIYLGANQDAFQAAGAMGFAKQNIGNYDIHNTGAMYASASLATRGVRSSNLMSVNNALENLVDDDGNLKVNVNADLNGPASRGARIIP